MSSKKFLFEVGLSVHNFITEKLFRLCLASMLTAGVLSAVPLSSAHAMTVISNTPIADAENIPVDSDITIKFDSTINSETVNAGMFTVKGTAFAFEVSESTITLIPEDDFICGEKVTVTVKSGGIESADGDPLTETWQWEFSIIHGITKTTPESNDSAASSTKIIITFSEEIVSGTVKESMFSMEGSLSGSHDFTFSVSGKSVTLTPDGDFSIGETVTARVSTGGIRVMEEIEDEELFFNVKSEIRQWQFTINTEGNIHYIDSEQAPLGSSYSRGVALRDLDGDEDIDAFVANGLGDPDDPAKRSNIVWVNDGAGKFSNSGQSLGDSYSYAVDLGDLDGDGDIDAFVANGSDSNDILTAPNKVWLNDGKGMFTDSGQSLGASDSRGIALGDLDGDRDIDAFVVNVSNIINDLDGANKVWINDGEGNFTESTQNLGGYDSYGVALGDFDNDGDLDAFVTNHSQPNKVWLNSGNGSFTDTGQSLGGSYSYSVALGDVDGDKDIDAFVANRNQPNKVWLNNGKGIFTDSGQNLGNGTSYAVVLKNIDAEGGIDAFVANAARDPNKVWLNNGKGIFSDSGRGMGSSTSISVSLGDLDGDDDLDAFVGNHGQSDKIWLNNSPPVITKNKDDDKSITSVSVDMDENETPIQFALTLYASDPEGRSLTWGFDEAISKRNIRTINGNLAYITGGNTGASQEIFYTPEENYSGEDSFDVWVSDGTDSTSVTVDVNISPNVPQITTEEDSFPVTMDEDSSPTAFSLTLNATDISDPEGELLTWSISSNPRKGTAETDSTGNSAIISYTPDQDYNGTDWFKVKVSDGAGGIDSITVNVSINPQNDAPLIAEGEENDLIFVTAETALTLEPEDVTVTVTDPDNIYPRDFTLNILEGENYTLAGDNVITPADDFIGTLTVPVTVSDGAEESNVFYLSVKVYLRGDIDGSGAVDLKDAVLGLRILTGTELGDISIDLKADDNGDDKITAEDVIFILQAVSG